MFGKEAQKYLSLNSIKDCCTRSSQLSVSLCYTSENPLAISLLNESTGCINTTNSRLDNKPTSDLSAAVKQK